jgi:hypothetical protein
MVPKLLKGASEGGSGTLGSASPCGSENPIAAMSKYRIIESITCYGNVNLFTRSMPDNAASVDTISNISCLICAILSE